jgi:hypothetical protein
MAKAKYPLAALLTVRGQATAAGKQQLAERMRAEAARRAEQELAAARLLAHDEAAARVATDHQRELRAGMLRAGDLALRAGELYVEQQVRSERALMAETAAARETEAQRESAAAQAWLAELRAAEEVVRLDQERFELKREQVQVAREEEAAEEAWRKRT